MSVSVFDSGSGDQPYLQWLQDHPTGWVLNSRRQPDPTYRVLHRPRCYSIGRSASNTHADPFTGRGYIKVCADDPAALLSWIEGYGGAGFSNRCSFCAV